jgi:hypothetical protein
MQIKLISGNFKANVTFGNLSTSPINLGTEKEPRNVPANEIVTDCGMTYIGQRDGWTGFYKGRLAKGEERDELAFTPELAAEVAKSLTETLSPYASDVSVEVEQHEKGETVSEMKRAQTLVDSFLGTEMETAYRQILGSPDGDRDALVKLAHEKKLGVTPPRAKKNGKATPTE